MDSVVVSTLRVLNFLVARHTVLVFRYTCQCLFVARALDSGGAGPAPRLLPLVTLSQILAVRDRYASARRGIRSHVY
jgi:hypothetical protein